MKFMNIAIVDDNERFIASFKNLVSEICSINETENNVETFNNSLSVIEDYNKYHLIFLDIDMPVLDGFSTAEKINALKGTDDFPYIVFVTCNDNLVFKALKCHPYSFIRKSELYEDTAYCIKLIQEKLNENSTRYCIKSGRKVIFINLNDVVFIEKVKNYVFYHTTTEVLKERCTMDEKEGELSQSGFFRTHIGYMVNVRHISEIAGNEIILDNSQRIPVSRRYKPEIKEKYYKWLVNMYD